MDRLGLCVHDAGGPIGLWWAVHRPERLDLSKLTHVAAQLQVFDAIPVQLIYGARDLILPDVAKTMQRVRAILPHVDAAP